jgi:plastocyanin
MRLKGIIAVATLGSLFLLGACGSDDEGASDDSGGGGSAAESVEITAADFSFDQDSIEVESGSEVEVTLTNEGNAEHSFSIEDPEFEIEAEGGESASGTFTAPDQSVEFFCMYHPDQMRGEITIGGSAAGNTDGGTDSSDTGGPYSD